MIDFNDPSIQYTGAIRQDIRDCQSPTRGGKLHGDFARFTRPEMKAERVTYLSDPFRGVRRTGSYILESGVHMAP